MNMRIKKDERWAYGLIGLTILLMFLKLFGVIDVPWIWVVSPVWFPIVILMLLVLVFAIALGALLVYSLLSGGKLTDGNDEEPDNRTIYF